MYTENKHTEIDSPPLPPAAVFDDEHLAAAQPVQPLPGSRWRRTRDFSQIDAGRRITAIASSTAGIIIFAAAAAASIDWHPARQPATNNTAQSASGAIASPITLQPSEAATKKDTHKRRSFSNPRVRETFPPLEVDEGDDDQKAKPRLVTVIH